MILSHNDISFKIILIKKWFSNDFPKTKSFQELTQNWFVSENHVYHEIGYLGKWFGLWHHIYHELCFRKMVLFSKMICARKINFMSTIVSLLSLCRIDTLLSSNVGYHLFLWTKPLSTSKINPRELFRILQVACVNLYLKQL